MDHVEDLKLEVIGAVYALSRENLIELCKFLGIDCEHVSSKSRSFFISLIVRHIEREALEELEDEGMAELLCLKDKICEIQSVNENSDSERQTAPTTKIVNVNPVAETTVAENTEQEKLQKEIDKLQSALQKLIVQKQRAANHTPQHTGTQQNISTIQSYSILPSPNVRPDTSSDLQFMTHRPVMPPWNREFKISGQIGEPGQKDKLTFSSLAHQIEHGLSRGVSELEIVDAVIRAIAPGMQLRSYLEGKPNLTLPVLRRILRAHYQERGATELYKQLTSEAQSSKETPQSFLVRCLDLRQKILFASQEAESSLKYDPNLVQSMFLHTVLTGLQNDSIRSDLQPYLMTIDVSDEILFDKVNVACANETERQNKKKLIYQHTKVNPVQVNEVAVEKKGKTQCHKNTEKVEPDILSELKEMRSDMALLKDLSVEVSQIKESILQPQIMSTQFSANVRDQTNMPPPQPQYPPQRYLQQYDRRMGAFQQPQWLPAHRSYPPSTRVRKCLACQQSGLDVYCTHCYRCGSSDHFVAGCRARGSTTYREQSLNGTGSRLRDEE